MPDLPSSFTTEAFDQLVAREHERLELESGAGRQPIQEAMVAFSNTDGGIILIGVTDERVVLGRRRDQSVDDAVHDAAADAHHVGRYEIREVAVGGTHVVAVIVHPRPDEVAATSDGRVLTRHGARNRATVGHDLGVLVTTRSLARFEYSESGLTRIDVDESLLGAVAHAHRWTDEATIDERLMEKGLTTASGALTIAGALILTDPARSLGAAKFHVDVRAYESDSGTSYVRREIVAGPVQAQVEMATDMVMRDIGTDMVITQAHRHDLPRLPRRVVREAIANAVAHRAYDFDRSPVVIELRPGALIVTSPGGLPLRSPSRRCGKRRLPATTQ